MAVLAVGVLVALSVLAAVQADASSAEPSSVIGGVRPQQPVSRTPTVPREVLVRFTRDVDAAERARARRALDVTVARSLPVRGLQVVRTPRGRSVRSTAAALERRPEVDYAEPNYFYHLAGVPNDPLFGRQWALHNTGQVVARTTGTVDADVDAPEAWDLTSGSHDVTVAVVDSGVAARHPDLAANLVPGYDFVEDDASPQEGTGHGTHVAGTVAARAGDGFGVAGVAPNVRLMPLRVFDARGMGTSEDIVRAFVYAREHGAKVVNGSFAGNAPSEAMIDTMAQSRDTLFVMAAGNRGSNLDDSVSWPCSATLENMVCVAASDQGDRLPSWSNYGSMVVDVAAPGTNILSTHPRLAVRFSEGFESELAGRWKLSGSSAGPWRRTSDWAAEGAWSLGAVGAGFPAAVAEIVNPIELGGYDHCRLELWLKRDTADDGRVDIEVRTPTSGWSRLAYFDDGQREDYFQLGLGSYEDEAIFLRLLFEGDIGDDRAYVDDMRVRCLSGDPPADSFELLSGTSMATPHVSGAAALRWSREPSASLARVRAAILAGADRVPPLEGKTASGRLNAQRTLLADPPADLPRFSGRIDTHAMGCARTGTGAAISCPWGPRGLSPTPDGGLLIADWEHGAIWRRASDGTLSVAAGAIGDEGFSGDGGPATKAQLDHPMDVEPQPDGGFLIADTYNRRVRRVAPDGTITTVAGSTASSGGDGGPATSAGLAYPMSVSTTADGGFLIADYSGQRVRKVDRSGRISTVAGGGTGSADTDGIAATSADIGPRSVDVLPDGGFLLIHYLKVYRVSPEGRMTALAGSGRRGFAGDGGPATSAALHAPADVAATPGGGFLIADEGNHRVRQVSPRGRIRTVAGTGAWGFFGNGGPADAAGLEYPTGVTVLADGSFLVSDTGHGHVRRVAPGELDWDGGQPVDAEPPETTLTAGPSGTTRLTEATFGFSASEPGSSFECRLDGGSWTSCTSPARYTDLRGGAHSFGVRARDRAGNVDPSPARREWTTCRPRSSAYSAVIASEAGLGAHWRLGESSGKVACDSAGTSDGVHEGAVTIGRPGLLAGDPDTAASLDGATAAVAVASESALGSAGGLSLEAWVEPRSADSEQTVLRRDGQYLLRLRGRAVVFRVWTASGTQLEVATGEVLEAGTGQHLVATYDGATLRVYRDGALVAWRAAVATVATSSAPLWLGRSAGYDYLGGRLDEVAVYRAPLSEDRIRAHYEAGSGRDITPPDTRLREGPTGTVASRSATFRFDSSDAGARFECRLDARQFASCTSPATYDGLADGAHEFAVRAVDASGNADPTPAVHRWSVGPIPGPSDDPRLPSPSGGEPRVPPIFPDSSAAPFGAVIARAETGSASGLAARVKLAVACSAACRAVSTIRRSGRGRTATIGEDEAQLPDAGIAALTVRLPQRALRRRPARGLRLLATTRIVYRSGLEQTLTVPVAMGGGARASSERVRVDAACSEDCRGSARLKVSRATARRLGLRSGPVLGTAQATLKRGRPAALVVKLGDPVRSRLSRSHAAVRASLSVRLDGGPGRAWSWRQTVVLARR